MKEGGTTDEPGGWGERANVGEDGNEKQVGEWMEGI